jgi:hypothetical protein
MKHITLFALLFCAFTVSSQVAIGTSTPAVGTLLHIEDANGRSGVLFPKVSIPDLANVSPLPAGSVDGIIVYNTNSTTVQGYYFLKNNRWEPIFGTVGGMAKFTNNISGNSSNNLNGNGADVQFCGNTYFNDNGTVFTKPSNTTLQVNEKGRYKVIVNISLQGVSNGNSRSLLAVEGQLRINNTAIGGVYRSGEMISPSSSAPDFSSITFTEIVNLNATDKLTVRVSRTQDNGNVFLRSNATSSIFIERLK